MKYHQDKKMKEQRAKKEESARLRRIASSIAKEVKQFWQSVEKVPNVFCMFEHGFSYILERCFISRENDSSLGFGSSLVKEGGAYITSSIAITHFSQKEL